MPWKASSMMEERLRYIARLLDGELMPCWCGPGMWDGVLGTNEASLFNALLRAP